MAYRMASASVPNERQMHNISKIEHVERFKLLQKNYISLHA
jgi:hypothetical protein